MAVSQKGGKDNSGDYVYVKNGEGQYRLDRHGHMIVDHDLHSHDGELPSGIAEAFIEWAMEEELSFWSGPGDGEKGQRFKAWRDFLDIGAHDRVYADPSIDISAACDEVNDIPQGALG